jgi:OFA family oxalate/formate antiporter-like MFS transporter
MKRYIVLAAACVMQMCLGATYSWSVFVSPLRHATGLSQGEVQAPFTAFYLAFPVTLLFASRLVDALGPRRSALLGTLLFGCGWLLAGLAGRASFLFVVAGVGLVAGIGVGCAYIVPIAVGNRWFPRSPGFVTGVAVGGFAVGAALVGYAAEAMMSEGVTPFDALRVLGAAFVLAGFPAAGCMAYPGEEARPAGPVLSRRELIRTAEFTQLFPAMMAGLAAGFAVNANLKDLLPYAGTSIGGAAVSVFALGNAAGRILWGWIFDRLEPSAVIRFNLFAQAAVLVGVVFLVMDVPSLLLFSGMAGFNYGGVLVLYASTAARRWGIVQVTMVYGVLFSANIVAAPAPVLAGIVFDLTGSFAPAFIALAFVAAVTAMRVRGQVDRKPGLHLP